MPTHEPAAGEGKPEIEGPFTVVDLGGISCPWYMLRFDRQGRLLSPRTADHLLTALGGGEGAEPITDVLVFSHGWNNDWRRATDLYRDFLGQLSGILAAHPPAPADGRPFRPIFVGITWPSISLVKPSERGPTIGGGGALDDDISGDDGSQDSVDFESLLAEARAALDRGDLAWADGDGEGEAGGEAGGEEGGLGIASDAFDDEDPDALPGFVDEGSASGAAVDDGAAGDDGPVGASGSYDPRKLVRVFTVWKMKDRAGRIGQVGMGPLLRRLLGVDGPRIHLLGHSFGARVMLTALVSSALADQRPVESLLLLQPAVNAWCFAGNVAGEGFEGGFRPALSRVVQPLVATYSPHDGPLCKVFPLALRRPHDLGETRMASGAEDGGSRWAALGGVGPLGLGTDECLRTELPAHGEVYAVAAREVAREAASVVPGSTAYALDGPRVAALDGERFISNHGDVANAATAWVLRGLLGG